MSKRSPRCVRRQSRNAFPSADQVAPVRTASASTPALVRVAASSTAGPVLRCSMICPSASSTLRRRTLSEIAGPVAAGPPGGTGYRPFGPKSAAFPWRRCLSFSLIRAYLPPVGFLGGKIPLSAGAGAANDYAHAIRRLGCGPRKIDPAIAGMNPRGPVTLSLAGPVLGVRQPFDLAARRISASDLNARLIGRAAQSGVRHLGPEVPVARPLDPSLGGYRLEGLGLASRSQG